MGRGVMDAAPPFPPHIMQCVQKAVETYKAPKIILLSILKVEAGQDGTASKNKNGTYDYGRAQINTIWIKKMENEHGIHQARELVQHNACYNIHTSAWILKQELKDATVNHPDFWRRVGNYHSRTKRLNERYQSLVYKAMLKIQKTKWK